LALAILEQDSPVEDARKTQPQITNIDQFKRRAFTGISSVGWIWSKIREKTRALSRASAQVIRDEVWKMAFRTKNARNGEAMRNARAAASDLKACLLISKDR
jgi:hypothetical protein